MPPVLIAGALTAGAAVYSSSQANKATSKGLDAQTAANDRALAEQAAARTQITQLNQPFITGGVSAYDRLLQQYGVGQAAKTPGGNAGTSPLAANGNPAPQAQPGAPAPDFNAYAAQNPDLAANNWYAQHPPESVGDIDGNGTVDQGDSAALHYQTHGQAEGRALPQGQGAQPTAQPGPTGPQPGTDLMSASRPQGLEQPTFGAAPSFSFSADDFMQSPGYTFARDEALRGVNAAYGARGMLKSDAAVKGVMGRAQGLASQEFNNWFSQQLQRQQADRGQFNIDRTTDFNIYNTQQNRQDSNFNADRGYQTNRYDTETGNLFDLTEIGLRAAGNVSGAANNYANNAGNIFGSQANAASDAAASRAATNAQLGGTIAGIGQNIFANAGSSYGNIAPMTAQSPYGYGNNVLTANNPTLNTAGLTTMPQVFF